MEPNIILKDKPISKVNIFFLATMIWSILIQLTTIPENAYQYIAFLIPISIYLVLNKNDMERILKPNMLNIGSILIIIIVWLASLPFIYLIIELYVSYFGNTMAEIIAEDVHDTFIFNFFFIAITPAILEELLMRGIILDGYRYKSNLVAALMNGLLFGMLHLNSFQFFYTFIIGFLASYLVIGTNSILAGMLIHSINNGFPLLINYLYPLDPSISHSESSDIFSLGIYAIIGIVIIFLLIRLLFKINNIPFKKEKSSSEEKIFSLPLLFSILIFLLFSALIMISI